MNNFKKGDVVVINDSSYSSIVRKGKLEVGHDYKDIRYSRCVIIELNCRLIRTSPWPGSNYNNTVVQNLETGEVIFIEERFLILAKHTIIIDGKTVELSHESFLNLKEQLV